MRLTNYRSMARERKIFVINIFLTFGNFFLVHDHISFQTRIECTLIIDSLLLHDQKPKTARSVAGGVEYTDCISKNPNKCPVAQLAGAVENTKCIFAKGQKPHLPHEFPDMTLNNLMVRL